MARPDGAYATLVKLQAIVHQKDQEVRPPHTSNGMFSAGAPRPLPVVPSLGTAVRSDIPPAMREQSTCRQSKSCRVLGERPFVLPPFWLSNHLICLPALPSHAPGDMPYQLFPTFVCQMFRQQFAAILLN